jgi:hypothetical protein
MKAFSRNWWYYTYSQCLPRASLSYSHHVTTTHGNWPALTLDSCRWFKSRLSEKWTHIHSHQQGEDHNRPDLLYLHQTRSIIAIWWQGICMSCKRLWQQIWQEDLESIHKTQHILQEIWRQTIAVWCIWDLNTWSLPLPNRIPQIAQHSLTILWMTL